MNKWISCIIFLLVTFITYASNVDTLIVHSQTMDKDIKNVVITPKSYAKKDKSYSVVYLLHGANGDYKDWLKKVPKLTEYADLYDVIIVCPDGHKTSWYFDSPVDSTMQYETYISKELLNTIDETYNTKPNKENRAITGLSMGGHGALYLAFKHTNVWGVAGSMSGGVDIRPFPLRWEIKKRLGNYSEHPERWEANTVINLLHLLDGENLKIMFDCGVDDFFYDANKRLHKKMLERNIPHDYIERPGGHTVKYWRNSIKYQMLFISQFFKNAEL